KQAPLALLQLQGAVLECLGDRVAVRIGYPSYEFANALGLGLYHQIAYVDSNLRPGDMSGLGDWFFRHIAFPDRPDNAAEYCERYFSAASGQTFLDVSGVLSAREQALTLLNGAIEAYDLASADLVGFTSMFSQHTACIAMARLLKCAR